MFQGPPLARHPFVVACKGCHSQIPAPVETMLDDWIIATAWLVRIGTPAPRLLCAVGDSVRLARMILKRVVGI